MNFLMFKLVLEKAEEPEIKLPTSTGSLKKEKSSRKTSISALLTMPKPLTVWITTNGGKSLKGWEYHQTTLPASWEICLQVKKQQLELDMEQQFGTTWFQIGKGVHQGCILSLCLFNFYAEYIIRNAWLESRLLGEISITSDMQMTPPLWQKVKRNSKASWWKWKRRVKKLA